ncbi:Single-stranded-DNA-specific exonuclease RecJ [Maioricimonas rarisocia]|uniref:Single-stranded-DNA-specific exonuclease RecJ n=1 Tax=Maioricimonas rarisocia TaxID=2528026 RepID=A0A517Z7P1_9PLAN|nr:single-stranded-DNA-specific exonuclease RecJ [Maioricimonas rarisocia]QDU38503.1 Single-stranded-DNA-specific exonuclease RecJ [Maioricimonas rarisocia]
MPRPWQFAPHDRGIITRLTREMQCSPLLAQVLASRGYESGDEANAFLVAKIGDLHDPGLLPGVSEAADRIVSAVKAGRRVTIYGDYDVDGVTSTSILWHCLQLSGAKVDYYIPCRLEEGYGLNLDALRTLHEEDPERLVITVDCGICSTEEADLAAQLGLELIITDHHTMDDELPRAACLVHPRLEEGAYPFPDLCGAGVAFKLAWAICQRLGDGGKASPRMREYLKFAVGLAAIGTIADVVPLVGENRIIVRYGLATLLEKCTPGLTFLMQVAGMQRAKSLTAEDIAFGIGPRINAAGRLGQARLAVELFTTDNETRAAQLAQYVDRLNKDRQTVERKIFRQAKELVEENEDWQDAAALVLAHPEWHPGVIGIVASRVCERFERPTVMIALNDEEGVGQGSARTYADFDLHTALTACRDRLLTFGGHKAAAGLRISKSEIDAFREEFARQVASSHQNGRPEVPLRIDAEVSLNDLNHRAVKELEHLGPFGCKHRRPVFAATGVELAEPPKRMGGGDRHLSLRVKQHNKVLRAVAFGKGDWAEELEAHGGPISICFSAGLNSYRGYESVELQLIDWQAEAAGRNAKSAATAVTSPTA